MESELTSSRVLATHPARRYNALSQRQKGKHVLARIHSFVLVGIDPLLCEVEVDVSRQGMEKTTVVGLAQAAVKESMERVRQASINSGYPFPGHRLLVNLAPADVKKAGPPIALPRAIGLLRGTYAID